MSRRTDYLTVNIGRKLGRLAGWCAALCLLAGLTPRAQAQAIVFDGVDWTLDRGSLFFFPLLNQSAIPYRQGTNRFEDPLIPTSPNPANNPGHAVRRWVWPRTADTQVVNPTPDVALQTITVDNFGLSDPQNSTDTLGHKTRVLPLPIPVAPATMPDPQQMAHSYTNGTFTNGGASVAPGLPADYRSPAGGFSFSNDPTQPYTADYFWIFANHDDFAVNRGNGTTSPATVAELAPLPYVDPTVYSAVYSRLQAQTNFVSYTCGSYNMVTGSYSIDIYSPGSGTVTGAPGNPIAHPSIAHAFVRVRYGHKGAPADVKTVDATGTILPDDPRFSRIFLVDISQSGWIHIAPGGRSPASFPYNGDPNYQLVVDVFPVTPDDVTDATLYPTPPVATADAVRFIPIPNASNSPGLSQTTDGKPASPVTFTMQSGGRILAPIVGTNKITSVTFPTTVSAKETQPLSYVAREESVPDPTPIIAADPTKAVDPTTNPLIADPSLQATAPVFYCIDNQNGNATRTDSAGNPILDAMGKPVQVNSTDKIRWRYVGLPDNTGGSGTASASPLLANVRCRDGIVRPILYYVTTDVTGALGHIYALDPVGIRVGNGVNVNTTNAYWVYPSYRPLSVPEAATGQFPAQLHDPNYNGSAPYATGVAAYDKLTVRDASGNFTNMLPYFPYGIGVESNGTLEAKYVDGDIIPNPSAAGHFTVRSDTQVTLGGMQSSPIVINDPTNPTGAQILVVGSMNGRVYCFDAGGRGDFTFDPTRRNDETYPVAANDPKSGLPYNLPGTTARYWTWPHLRGDAFHAKIGSGVTNAVPNAILDEPNKVAFPSSAAFDPNAASPSAPADRNPVYLGAADGHMFALSPGHDTFNGVSNTNLPQYKERRIWVYPNLNSPKPTSTTADTQTLGAAPSTPTIFKAAGSNTFGLYFTCAGRVYAINERPSLNASDPTFIPNTNTTWVWPPTSNPPFVDPTLNNSAPLDPGFSGSAPMLVAGTRVGLAAGTDGCYVVGADGTVYLNNAASGALLATGQSLTGAATVASPIASDLIGLLGFSLNTTTPVPSVVFADDDGGIYGIGATPDTTQQGPVGPAGTSLLPIVWGHNDSGATRIAAASLVNGMIIEGDEGGQLRAYGVGTGADGLGATLGTGEPAEIGFGIDQAGTSIDLRGLDLYDPVAYAKFTTSPPTATPAHTSTGGTYGASVNPLPGNIPNGNGALAVDWGDGLYIAAYGVYHAQPQNNTTGAHAPGDPTGIPKIEVVLTITLPGQPSITKTLDATPSFTSPVGSVTNGNSWPDDPAITSGEHTGISIYGVDDPTQLRNALSNTNGEKLTGRDAGVFPFVVYYKLPIIPDATKNFTPGSAGYRITAYATILQEVVLPTMMTPNPPPQPYTARSNVLGIGQHDYAGLTPIMGNGTIASPVNPVAPVTPNQLSVLGRQRAIYITNPLGITVRSYASSGNAAQDNTGGNKPNIIGLGPSASRIASGGGSIYEVLGNGNRVFDPYAAANAPAASPLKPLFAPIGMIPHNSSGQYLGVDNAGNKRPAFYIADRSNLAYTGPGGAGQPLRVRVYTKPPHWLGGDSSVMNPLPWDQMPNDAQDSRDYPNLPASALEVNHAASGQSAIASTVALTPPDYSQSADPLLRLVQPTQFNMIAHIPKYQPANVNRGVVAWSRKDGTNLQFGSALTDMSGVLRGTLGGGSQLVGPLNIQTGNAPGGALTYPAGGYTSEVVVEVIPPGTGNAVRRFNPQDIFNDSRAAGNSSIAQAYRAFELGLTVPPSVKMRVLESTVDLGKLPHGAGISDIAGSNYRVPFAPAGTAPFPGTTAPWDDDNQLGKFFRPITLVNESNVNLYDVRIGKLLGQVGSKLGNLVPLTLASSETGSIIMAPPTLNTTAANAGQPGVVSSFDHLSTTSNANGNAFFEQLFWPLPNPYVSAAGISAAVNSGLQDVDAPAAGLRGWKGGVQPQPTVHKPRTGDASGTIATIPDVPYDAAAIPGFAAPQAPKVGLAIPIGTPVGTYSTPVYPFEDNIPLQWQEWLTASGNNAYGNTTVNSSHDGVINVASDGKTPIENYADPSFNLKVTVREARLTTGTTKGTLSEIDPLSQSQFGFNLLPSVIYKPFSNNQAAIALYWATNRQPSGSPYITAAGNAKANLPVADAPWSLAISSLVEGAGGWTFSQAGTGTNADGVWWNPFSAGNLFPGYNGTTPAGLPMLFPATPAESSAAGNIPFLPGVRADRTVRHASPAAVVRIPGGPAGSSVSGAQPGYLFWQGQIDKKRTNGAVSSTSQITESRTFYAPIAANSAAAPTAANTQSFLNDPALTKLSPKPLYLTLGGTDYLFLFWHAGNGAQTSLYYNTNAASGFPSSSWSRDTKLETPSSLAWQSDPYPVYHQTADAAGNTVDVIDVFYTGVLKTRRSVETLMSRYVIVPGVNGAPPTLSIMFLPQVVQEQMSRNGTGNTFTARDAAWAYGTGPAGTYAPTDTFSQIQLYISTDFGKTITPLVQGVANGNFPLGKFDPASGLLYFDSVLGGQIVVDARSGAVSFPQVAPKRNDIVYVSYVPQAMRLNTSRDETNLISSAGYGSFSANDPAFSPRPAITSPGSSANPVAIMERDNNERAGLASPKVVFGNGTFPRLWVLYRRSDVSGNARSSIYYKAMRLMARLPRPVTLTGAPGSYAIKNINVTGNAGPFEVDWARGRVYFTELDEGRTVSITYDAVGVGGSGKLTYRVAWGDEISSTTQAGAGFVDYTTPEVVLPSDSSVNEGQVAAFQIPAGQRITPSASQPFLQPQGSELWVFWTSTRGGSADLYYETIKPNFYPFGVNQQ